MEVTAVCECSKIFPRHFIITADVWCCNISLLRALEKIEVADKAPFPFK